MVIALPSPKGGEGNLFLDSKPREFKLWVDAYNKKYETSLVYPPPSPKERLS